MSKQWERKTTQYSGVHKLLSGLLVGIWLILGLFAGALFFGLALVASGLLLLRLWWIRRHLLKPRQGTRPAVIEGEYHVVETEVRQGSVEDV
ncbi:MAG: hypothetical protein P8103_01825 [Candidatus Thiodiazotropha sp.]